VTGSQITGREGVEIGTTLVLHDVTARKRRTRRLREQRDELEGLVPTDDGALVYPRHRPAPSTRAIDPR
jgi:hypothetical protein